ncbi:MAG: glycoside hydrolase family 31 protein [Saccharofermentans sp.]|nr:glycoside hydrolase family 31 protein [Saccharofermentans sp.]
MIKKYIYGNPFPTEAVVENIEVASGEQEVFKLEDGAFLFTMSDDDIVYGLGEQIRGINKRGWQYVNWNFDNPHHHEDTRSLYGSHNFIIISGKKTFGVFFDYAGEIVFDIGYTVRSKMTVRPASMNLVLYIIDGENEKDIVKQFRGIIGKSYIPPFWAFGYGQSRWGYKDEHDIREVAQKYKEKEIPLDSIYMDIDYMERYKDFTVNKERFPDFMKPEARVWFGAKYKTLMDLGIDGFWNDMNEPAIFYVEDKLNETLNKMQELNGTNVGIDEFFDMTGRVGGLNGNKDYYSNFYHQVDGKLVNHKEIHNLYGMNMTRAANEALEKIKPDEKTLFFSRSSYIGAHRYGGIWQGDNKSWWGHILQSMQQLPALNMAGFMFIGADVGGFGCDTTEDLMIRWLQYSMFTPLFRNHSAMGTREQELYRFSMVDDMKEMIKIRYCLIPYLYETFMKAVDNDDMMFRPLGFDFPVDDEAKSVDDQLLLGNELMIAPIYKQNAKGRYVYLPEDMMLIRMRSYSDYETEVLSKGHHYVKTDLNELVFFIRNGKSIPWGEPASSTATIDMSKLTRLGFVV